MKLFSAAWCSNCKPAKEYILSNNLDVEIVDVDTDDGAVLASTMGIRSLPAFYSEESGVVIGTMSVMKELKGL